MTIVTRGTTIGCANPVLEIYTSDGLGAPSNVSVLEFQICDLTGPSPVQVFPATLGDREALDPLTDCPGGARLGTGRYAAAWAVPEDANLGNYAIKWFFRSLPASPELTFESPFEVSDTVASAAPLPASVQSFLDRFPQFASTSVAVIQAVLDEASRMMACHCWGNRYEDAQRYLAAHLLALTGSSRGSGAASVSAGSASISFGGIEAGFSALEKTGFGRQYLMILRASCGPGARTVWQ